MIYFKIILNYLVNNTYNFYVSFISIIFFINVFISINTRFEVRSRHWDIFDILLRLKRTNSITSSREKNRERERERKREKVSEHWAKYADSVGGCYAFAVIPTKNGSISVVLQRYEKGSTNWRPIHSVSSSGSHKKATHLDFLWSIICKRGLLHGSTNSNFSRFCIRGILTRTDKVT